MKKAKFPLFLACVAMVCISQADDVEFTVNGLSGLALYEWFDVEVAFNVDLSHVKANEIVEHALSSKDPELIHHAVSGMAFQSAVANGRWDELMNPTGDEVYPIRTFDQIPGLKTFLINYYREGYLKNGPIHESKAIVVNGTQWWRVPAWKASPTILATYFPNDPVVHDFIFEIDTEEFPYAPVRTLSLLSVGKFRTEEANRYRIECLQSCEGEDAQRLAAETLGEFRTPSGLLALQDALNLDHRAFVEIATSIMAYGDPNSERLVREFLVQAQGDARPRIRDRVRVLREVLARQ